jgi:flavin reductase (DIM6/NTAB) family NADH-FMN oxidoreductase RutF
MFYRTDENSHGLPRDPFKALVAPRPIGWISTLDRDGNANLAPYSYFNACHTRPPVVMIGAEPHPDGDRGKDTERIIEETGEFVCNLVTYALREAMNQTSAFVDGDEFEHAGLEKAPAELVRPPRVAASPAHLECRYLQSIQMPGTGDTRTGRLVLGQVVGIHIDDSILTDGRVDVGKVRPLARLGYMDYAVIDQVFRMDRPG